ncbi:hypothetical protein [Polaromonas aquatica]|uniref:hypothetical protein n=1 Tax=Polaromonas aquatica TaxID=332657 RepID=UPI003D65B322
MSTSERKEWRRSFTEKIMELANGRIDVLEAASWAMEAQHIQGYRDPQEVAREQFKSIDTPVLVGDDVSGQMPTRVTSQEFLLTRPDQNLLDAGPP